MRIPFLLTVRPVLAVVACTALGACNLIIPENPSTPRYNTVVGEVRKPEQNPGGSPARRAAPARMAPQSAAFPPVDPATEARAQEIMASDVPPPMMAAPAMAGRQMPVENNGTQMAASDYPNLHQIPATAPEPDAAARLARVRAQLEADRAAAGNDARRLATDAAAEPSLLNEPVPAPITPMAPQSSYTPPAPGMIALPPPPPPLAQSAGTAWDRSAAPMAVASAPMSSPPLEPIVLRAPGASVPNDPSPFGYSAPAAAPAPSMSPAMAGGFNPMAGTEPITLRPPTTFAGSTSYLPNSRYATRRN